MAGDIAETLKHLNISRAVLIGHSIGGRVAMELALSMPDSVEKLIVEDLPPMVVPAPLIAGILSAMLNLDFTQVKNSNDADDMLRESIPVSVLINIQSIFIITTLRCSKSYLLLLQYFPLISILPMQYPNFQPIFHALSSQPKCLQPKCLQQMFATQAAVFDIYVCFVRLKCTHNNQREGFP